MHPSIFDQVMGYFIVLGGLFFIAIGGAVIDNFWMRLPMGVVLFAVGRILILVARQTPH